MPKFCNNLFFQKRASVKRGFQDDEVIEKLISVGKRIIKPSKTLTSNDLELNHYYKVTRLSSVKTTYGWKIIAGLDEKYDYFLPERYSRDMFEHGEQLIKIEPDDLYLVYRGRGVEQAVLLEFRRMAEAEAVRPPSPIEIRKIPASPPPVEEVVIN